MSLLSNSRKIVLKISKKDFENFEIFMKFYCYLSWKVHLTSLAAR